MMNKDLLNMSCETFITAKFANMVLNWDKDLEIMDNGPKDRPFWAKQYKGITFATVEELKERCFLFWCRDNKITDFVANNYPGEIKK